FVFDIHLSGMSGIELRRRLAAAGCAVPVIFMTAFDDEATRQEAMSVGCIAYLNKPFTADLLIGAIDKIGYSAASPRPPTAFMSGSLYRAPCTGGRQVAPLSKGS